MDFLEVYFLLMLGLLLVALVYMLISAYYNNKRCEWRTTATNRFGHPTIQTNVRTGMTRQLTTKGCGRLRCKWVYSDGSESKEFDFGDQGGEW